MHNIHLFKLLYITWIDAEFKMLLNYHNGPKSTNRLGNELNAPVKAFNSYEVIFNHSVNGFFFSTLIIVKVGAPHLCICENLQRMV